MAKNRV
jgi:hypothetical protein